jgi:hypothetical protein
MKSSTLLRLGAYLKGKFTRSTRETGKEKMCRKKIIAVNERRPFYLFFIMYLFEASEANGNRSI